MFDLWDFSRLPQSSVKSPAGTFGKRLFICTPMTVWISVLIVFKVLLTNRCNEEFGAMLILKWESINLSLN